MTGTPRTRLEATRITGATIAAGRTTPRDQRIA
jgi:hypothetical protein